MLSKHRKKEPETSVEPSETAAAALEQDAPLARLDAHAAMAQRGDWSFL